MLDLRGKTALITGASAGIGREMARVLGREVDALVLVARRKDRLDELAEELGRFRKELRVTVRAVDLGDRAAAGAMLDELAASGIAIDVFINNAGYGDWGVFEKSEWSKIEGMLQLNMVTATFLLHRLVPPMVARGFGAILNVGSTAGMVALPGFAAYGATKAYFNHLSDALRSELSGTGVTVTALCPGPVPTEFQEVAGSANRPGMPDALSVTAEDCAEQAIAGLKHGRARVVPGLLGFLPLEGITKALTRPFAARMGRKIRARSSS